MPFSSNSNKRHSLLRYIRLIAKDVTGSFPNHKDKAVSSL